MVNSRRSITSRACTLKTLSTLIYILNNLFRLTKIVSGNPNWSQRKTHTWISVWCTFRKGRRYAKLKQNRKKREFLAHTIVAPREKRGQIMPTYIWWFPNPPTKRNIPGQRHHALPIETALNKGQSHRSAESIEIDNIIFDILAKIIGWWLYDQVGKN